MWVLETHTQVIVGSFRYHQTDSHAFRVMPIFLDSFQYHRTHSHTITTHFNTIALIPIPSHSLQYHQTHSNTIGLIPIPS
jgi:hypothetical protein